MIGIEKKYIAKLEKLNCSYRTDYESAGGRYACKIKEKTSGNIVLTAWHSDERSSIIAAIDNLSSKDIPQSPAEVLQDNVELRQQNEALRQQLAAAGQEPSVPKASANAMKLALENDIKIETVMPANGIQVTVADIKAIIRGDDPPVPDEEEQQDSGDAVVTDIPYTPNG